MKKERRKKRGEGGREGGNGLLHEAWRREWSSTLRVQIWQHPRVEFGAEFGVGMWL